MSHQQIPSKKRYRIPAAAVAIGMLAVIVYYGVTVWRARLQTPELVRSILVSDRVEIRSSDLSVWQKCALLSVHDPDFYRHSGVNRPLWKAFTGTTITQAVVKRLYFDSFKPGIMKIRQTLIARYALDALTTKEDQITLYINLVWFGQLPGGKAIFGFADAARAYFNKPVAQLSEEQFLALVVVLYAPNRFNPYTHPKESSDRVAQLEDLVINRCGRQGPGPVSRFK